MTEVLLARFDDIAGLVDIGSLAVLAGQAGKIIQVKGTEDGYEFVTPATTIDELGDVGDVTITTIASGELLQWNGAAWINQTFAELDILTVTAAAAAYQPLDAGLTDIAGLAVTDGNFIVGDGANWVAESGATARASLGLGTAATANTGTSGTTLPFLDGANTWSALQIFSDIRVGDASNGLFYDTTNDRIAVGFEEFAMTIAAASIGSKVAIHTEAGEAALELHSHETGAGILNCPVLYGARSDGSEATETIVVNTDFLFAIAAVGFDGTDYAQGGRIDFKVDGTPGAGDMPTRIDFLTSADGSETPTLRMSIRADGSVEISGTSLTLNSIAVPTISSVSTFTNKTIDGDSNTLSNLDIGNEVDWAAAADVADRSAAPATGDKLLLFEAGVGLRKIDWSDLPAGGGGGALGDLSDVTITAVASGEILKYNGTIWVNNTLAEAGISATGHTHSAADITSGTLAIARGGTNAGTAAAAFANLKQAASDTATGVLEIAVQSEIEAGSSATLAVTPGRQHFHPSACKAWAKFDVAANLDASYNVTSVTDIDVGEFTVTFDTDFSTANYCVVATAQDGTNVNSNVFTEVQAAGTINLRNKDADGNTPADPDEFMVAAFGDHA